MMERLVASSGDHSKRVQVIIDDWVFSTKRCKEHPRALRGLDHRGQFKGSEYQFLKMNILPGFFALGELALKSARVMNDIARRDAALRFTENELWR